MAGATRPLMDAWVVEDPAPMAAAPLRRRRLERPEPGRGEVRVRVVVCGVCRTDLHVAEGDLPVHRPQVVPGHEVVGQVDALGPGAGRFRLGDRVGMAWLASTCGRCRFCRRGDENLCPAATFTGWDRDGGYAQWVVGDERYLYRLPEDLPDDQAAPLLCAGIIGYRALRLAELPPGGRLGLYGFGASAHITAQVALHQGAEVHAFTRAEEGRALARRLGCHSAGPVGPAPPAPLDAAVVFAPSGEVVPAALAALDRGGVVVVAGIHLSDIPPLRYQEHLFQERRLRSVTANTRRDGEELLRLAPRLGVRAAVTEYPLAAAAEALADLSADRVTGAAVLRVGPGD